MMLDGLGLWVRAEWRTGWRVLLALALLIVAGGGATIVAAAGARRADTAFDRLLAAEASPIQLILGAQGENSDIDRAAWDRLSDDVAAVPGVRGTMQMAWMGVALQAEGRPLEFFSATLGGEEGIAPPHGAPAIRGRLVDPNAADEVNLNEEAARRTGAEIGDVIQLRSYAPDQRDEFLSNANAPDRGPRIDVEVVGIVRGSEDVAYNPESVAFMSGAFYDRYENRVASCRCGILVNAAPSDVESVVAQLPVAIGDVPLIIGQYNTESGAIIRHAVSLEVGALWIAAVVAGLASLVATSQLIVRHVGSRRRASGSLSALGATRRSIVSAWLVVFAPALVAGAAGAALLAVRLSSLLPRGLARRADPTPGLRIDTLVVAGGALLLVAIATATVWAVVRRDSASHRTPTMGRTPRWLPGPVAVLGANLAVDPAGARSRLLVTIAVLGVALGVGGFVAVDVIEGSAVAVLDTPSAYGADWNLEIFETPEEPDDVIEATLQEGVEAFALRQIIGGNDFEAHGPNGSVMIQPVAFDSIVGHIGPFVDVGEPLAGADDVVLGDALAASLGAAVGDEIEIGPQAAVFRVSGIGRLTDDDETNEAAVVTMDGLRRVNDGASPTISGAMVRTGDVDDAAMERLVELGWRAPQPPSKVANLDQIGSVPSLLAVGLALLAVVGLVHALLTAAGRRGIDVAVARALGFTPGQAARAIMWQGLLTGGAGLLVGVPLGIVVGRVVWRRIAEGVGATELVAMSWLQVMFAVAVAFAVFIAAGGLVGRRAATLRPTELLRSE